MTIARKMLESKIKESTDGNITITVEFAKVLLFLAEQAEEYQKSLPEKKVEKKKQISVDDMVKHIKKLASTKDEPCKDCDAPDRYEYGFCRRAWENGQMFPCAHGSITMNLLFKNGGDEE